MSVRSYPHIASRFLNEPLAIKQSKAVVLVSVLASRLGIEELSFDDGMGAVQHLDAKQLAATAKMAAAEYDDEDEPRKRRGRYIEVRNGAAIIKVEGTLVHKNGGAIGAYSGMQSYEGIKHQVLEAMDSSDVKGIFMEYDTNGGEVAGCADVADLIYSCNARNGGKPIFAIANEAAYSAGYWLAATADRLFVPRLGGVGSVGVIWLHAEYTKRLENEGIAVRVFRSGAEKAKGNPYEEMDDATAARIQAEMDKMRDLFVKSVAHYRPGLTEKSVRETEALTYMGDDARALGFVTAVASRDQAWAKFMARLGRD